MPVYIALLEDPYTKNVSRVTLFQDTEHKARAHLIRVYGQHVKIIALTERDNNDNKKDYGSDGLPSDTTKAEN